MAKKGKKSKVVQPRKGKSNHIGTINGNELLMNRSGKVNLGTHPEIRGAVHKSLKDYDRNREKREIRSQIQGF